MDARWSRYSVCGVPGTVVPERRGNASSAAQDDKLLAAPPSVACACHILAWDRRAESGITSHARHVHPRGLMVRPTDHSMAENRGAAQRVMGSNGSIAMDHHSPRSSIRIRCPPGEHDGTSDPGGKLADHPLAPFHSGTSAGPHTLPDLRSFSSKTVYRPSCNVVRYRGSRPTRAGGAPHLSP